MVEYNSVKDSGERQEFNTGARRDTQSGKGRYDLLPPRAIKRLAKHYENGAKKYGDRNWEKGMPLSRFMDSAMRHMFKTLEGQRDEDHLIAAAWNILGIAEIQERIEEGLLPKELDDIGLLSSAPEKTIEKRQENGQVKKSPVNKKLVYVAGAYTAPTDIEVERNVKTARDYALKVCKMGFSVICPHMNTKGYERDGMTYEEVMENDFEQVARCDGMFMVPNWENSKGSLRERKLAIELGLPIFYSFEELEKFKSEGKS